MRCPNCGSTAQYKDGNCGCGYKVTTPNGNVMSRVDNDRLHEFTNITLSIGDAEVGLDELNLQSPKARTELRNAKAALFNAQQALKRSFNAEYDLAVKNGKK